MLLGPIAILQGRAAIGEAESLCPEAPSMRFQLRFYRPDQAGQGEGNEATDAAGAGGLRQHRDGEVYRACFGRHCVHDRVKFVPLFATCAIT